MKIYDTWVQLNEFFEKIFHLVAKDWDKDHKCQYSHYDFDNICKRFEIIYHNEYDESCCIFIGLGLLEFGEPEDIVKEYLRRRKEELKKTTR